MSAGLHFPFVEALFFWSAMLFGALANGCAFFVLNRMRSIGYPVGLWRTINDWALDREYWKIAPSKGWSRFPLLIGIAAFVVAAILMFSGVRFPLTQH
jgi:hypothetical protein